MEFVQHFLSTGDVASGFPGFALISVVLVTGPFHEIVDGFGGNSFGVEDGGYFVFVLVILELDFHRRRPTSASDGVYRGGFEVGEVEDGMDATHGFGKG